MFILEVEFAATSIPIICSWNEYGTQNFKSYATIKKIQQVTQLDKIFKKDILKGLPKK